MRRRWNDCAAFLLMVTTLCGGCAGRGGWLLPWFGGSDNGPTGDVSKFEHPATDKPSPMQALASTLTFGRSASKANEEAARRAATIPEGDPLSLQNMPSHVGPDVYVHAARLYEIQNNFPQAASNYERALAADPKNEAALLGFARLHDRQGKFDKATELYTKAIASNPENARIHNDLAICLNRQGKTQESLQAMQKAIELEPREPLYRNNIAKMLVQAGRDQEALEQLNAAFPPAAAHYNIGYLLYENKRPDLAGFHFARALELQPGFAQAGKMMQVVQAVATTPRNVPDAPQPQLNIAAEHGPALPGAQIQPNNASRYSQLPALPSVNAPVQQPYADRVDNAPVLAPPVVEMPR